METKLNPNARKWVRALRSGKYKQARWQLCKLTGPNKTPSYCCLGVACEVFIRSGGKLRVKEDGVDRLYDSKSGMLPLVVKNWLGLKMNDGAFYGDKNSTTLVDLNDIDKKRFKVIANIIESRPEGLFE